MPDQRYSSMDKSTIAAGAALGSAIRLAGSAIVGLVLDAAWDTQIITFQTSPDGGTTWVPIYLDDANTELQIPNTAAVASRAIAMNTVLDKLAAFNYIRPRSGTTVSPQNQVDETVITFILKS
jgi:hypothetical protein